MNHLLSKTLNRRTFLQLTGGAAVAIAAAGCVAPSTTQPQPMNEVAEPEQGGILRLAMPDGVTSLDPSTFLSTADMSYGFAVYDTLVRLSEGEAGAPLYPQLAESWELSEDALTYTFHLREGVTFHHGTAFTAQDVEFTMQRLLDPTLGLSVSSVLAIIDHVESVDDLTIQFHLKAPSVTLPYILGRPGIEILPHDRTDEQRATAPSGTGPFAFVEHMPGERTVLARNESYWQANLPYLDELHFVEVSETATQIASLTSGTIDAIVHVGIENLATLTATEGVQIVESLQGTYPVFVMDVTAEPFDDVRVRQAFKHAINREALQQVVLQGRGAIMNDQPVVPETPLWADVAPLTYDVEKAKALLAEAGYADGIEVTLAVAEVMPLIVEATVVIQEMVKEAGITINLNRVPIGNYWSDQYGKVPFCVDVWSSNSEPDGQLSLAYTTGGSFNVSNWSDPQVDELIITSRGESDIAIRKEESAQIQQIISQEGGVIIPYLMPIIAATRTNVRGLIPSNFLSSQFIWVTTN